MVIFYYNRHFCAKIIKSEFVMTKNYQNKAPFIAKAQVSLGVRFQGTFPFHLFSLTLSGGATYQLPTGKIEIEQGDLLCFAPQAWQDWQVTKANGWEVCYLIIELPAHLLDLVPEQNISPGISKISLQVRDEHRVARVFREMMEWQTNPTPVMERILVNQIEYIFLLTHGQTPVLAEDPRILKARNYLYDNMEKKIDLSDVSLAASLSIARLTTLFNATQGMPPISFLEKIRMERAAQLLIFTTATIDSIATRLGYNERKYFDKRFKQRWGKTPRKYREER
jgi:AraC-like DNA-binding protein